jgi:MFS family permease
MNRLSGSHTLRAFRSRKYALYFTGRSVSQFGTWMQRTAVVWVVYSMTNSAFWVGVAIFAEQFPSFLFSIPGGVAADRYDRHKIINLMQILSIMQSVLMALMVITGHTTVWAILALSVVLGVINAFDVPARQTLVHEVVTDPEDLPSAISLTTAMASLAQLLGPVLSGIVLSVFGAAVCFFVNAASFGAVMLSLWLMKLPAMPPKNKDKKVLAEFAEGFAYLKRTPNIAWMIVLLGLVSLLVLPYNTVLPVFAKEIFKGNASTFGLINGFIGAGAVVATVFLASRKPGAPLKKILFISMLVMGVGMICFSQARYFPLAMFFTTLAGFGGIALYTVSNIVAQSESAPEMRGRVIGIMLMAIFGMAPLGSLVVGAVSQHIGAPATVLIQGIIAIVLALVFTRFLTRPATKPAVIDVPVEEVEELVMEEHV